MSTASSLIADIDTLIADIDTALHYMASRGTPFHCYIRELKFKIALRNIKSLVFCLRNLGDDDAHLRSLFSRIKGVITERQYDREAVIKIYCLEEEIMDFQTSRSVSLTPEDVVRIADCFLENTFDYVPSSRHLWNWDALKVHINWCLKKFLLFAMRSGTTDLELENLLFQIQPLAIKAVSVYVASKFDFFQFPEVVVSNCETLFRMATSPQLYQAYTRVLRIAKSNIHLEMDYADVLNFLVALLWDVLRRGTYDHLVFMKDRLKMLYERLRFSRSTLKQQPYGKVRDQIGVLVCDAGMLICSLYQEDVRVDLGLLSDVLQRFDDIVQEAQVPRGNELKFSNSDTINSIACIKSIKISDGSREGNEDKGRERAMQSQQPPQSDFPIVGFSDDELTSIVDQLTRGVSKHLRMVAISGMAGIGKTTLALKAFNIASVRYCFHVFAWCTISQVLEKKKVLVELLNQIHASISYSEMTENELANKLRKSLKGKKYLIVLDDVWTNEMWNSLAESFPDDSTQSRIIITSRQYDVVPRGLLVNGESHSLRLRKDHECLEILRSKLFPEKDWPLELADFGIKIAAKCKGLPLTSIIVAGLLATTNQEDWKGILDDLSSGAVSGAEQCNSSLELSYNHLPRELQLCFLYFGMFPKDQIVPTRSLIQLWMAEGLVKHDNLKRKEDVARGYLNGLIERNLVMITKRRSMGGVKTCLVHDVLHDFCVKRAKQESFFHILLQRYDQLSNFIEPCSLQRLCIHSKLNHFVKSRIFCPRTLSLLFFSTQGKEESLYDMSFIFHIFKLIQVLDIGKIRLPCGIPSEMQFLTHLKYLSICCYVSVIPSWIGNLSNLETFIVDITSWGNIPFPDTLWNLQKLKYLYISRNVISLPAENLDNSLVLSELETLVGGVFDANFMEKQMRKFPNIRRLKCRVKRGLESKVRFIKIVIPDLLTQLESLSIGGRGELICEFGSPENLRKVRLEDFDLSRDEVAMMGNFPKLEILKLVNITFPEGTLEMEEGAFSKLRVLILSDITGSLKRWTASDEQLPSLQKLVLINCDVLEEIPSCLETILTLKKIHVFKCSTLVEGLVKDIEKVHSDYGNSVEVRIHSFFSEEYYEG